MTEVKVKREIEISLAGKEYRAAIAKRAPEMYLVIRAIYDGSLNDGYRELAELIVDEIERLNPNKVGG